eukprot:1423745-Pleurochrysis_carterae.AAC.1
MPVPQRPRKVRYCLTRDSTTETPCRDTPAQAFAQPARSHKKNVNASSAGNTSGPLDSSAQPPARSRRARAVARMLSYGQ